jgi:hypothetical protein
MITGQDIIIKIGTTDYSNDIEEFTESGGEQEIRHIKTFGNNYESVVINTEDYNLDLNFKVEGTTLKTLYESISPVTITLTLGSECIITYNNMLPKKLNYELPVDDLTIATLTYTAPAFTSGTNNRVIT